MIPYCAPGNEKNNVRHFMTLVTVLGFLIVFIVAVMMITIHTTGGMFTGILPLKSTKYRQICHTLILIGIGKEKVKTHV